MSSRSRVGRPGCSQCMWWPMFHLWHAATRMGGAEWQRGWVLAQCHNEDLQPTIMFSERRSFSTHSGTWFTPMPLASLCQSGGWKFFCIVQVQDRERRVVWGTKLRVLMLTNLNIRVHSRRGKDEWKLIGKASPQVQTLNLNANFWLFTGSSNIPRSCGTRAPICRGRQVSVFVAVLAKCGQVTTFWIKWKLNIVGDLIFKKGRHTVRDAEHGDSSSAPRSSKLPRDVRRLYNVSWKKLDENCYSYDALSRYWVEGNHTKLLQRPAHCTLGCFKNISP